MALDFYFASRSDAIHYVDGVETLWNQADFLTHALRGMTILGDRTIVIAPENLGLGHQLDKDMVSLGYWAPNTGAYTNSFLLDGVTYSTGGMDAASGIDLIDQLGVVWITAGVQTDAAPDYPNYVGLLMDPYGVCVGHGPSWDIDGLTTGLGPPNVGGGGHSGTSYDLTAGKLYWTGSRDEKYRGHGGMEGLAVYDIVTQDVTFCHQAFSTLAAGSGAYDIAIQPGANLLWVVDNNDGGDESFLRAYAVADFSGPDVIPTPTRSIQVTANLGIGPYTNGGAMVIDPTGTFALYCATEPVNGGIAIYQVNLATEVRTLVTTSFGKTWDTGDISDIWFPGGEVPNLNGGLDDLRRRFT